MFLSIYQGGIVRVDPVLGSQLPVSIGGLLMGGMLNAIAANATDELFVLAEPFATPVVVKIDPLTGAGSEVGPYAGPSSVADLAIDSTGQLFGWAESSDDLVRIDVGVVCNLHDAGRDVGNPREFEVI